MNTETKIRIRVVALRESVENDVDSDEENWHVAEDQILYDALLAISRGARNPRAVAREAIKVDAIEFCRWYA